MHHSLQQESYHEPETPIVEEMASTGRAVVIQRNDLMNDHQERVPMMREAVTLCSTRNGPASYNTWQSVYFGLKKEHTTAEDENVG